MDSIFRIKEDVVTKIDVFEDSALISIKGPANGNFQIQEILQWIYQENISINLTMKQVYLGSWSFSFSCLKDEKEKFFNSGIERRIKEKDLYINIIDHLSEITVAGVGMATTSGVVKRIFSTLLNEKIEFYHITTTETSVTFTVKNENTMKAVIALSTEFGL